MIMDKSSSMVRANGNIFDLVKKSMEDFINPLKENDVVQLITFDMDVNIFPPIKIKSADTNVWRFQFFLPVAKHRQDTVKNPCVQVVLLVLAATTFVQLSIGFGP